jgi:hypothetical protein
MDPVLFVRQAAHFQSMELERAEAICGFESSSRSRLWGTRGDCAASQEVAVFGLGLSRDISTDKLLNVRDAQYCRDLPSFGTLSHQPNWPRAPSFLVRLILVSARFLGSLFDSITKILCHFTLGGICCDWTTKQFSRIDNRNGRAQSSERNQGDVPHLESSADRGPLAVGPVGEEFNSKKK